MAMSEASGAAAVAAAARTVAAAFKMHGLMLRSEARKFLSNALAGMGSVELENMLEQVVDAVQRQPLASSMVELAVVEAAVQECRSSSPEESENVFNIIGAFDIPRFIYNHERKKLIPLAMTNHPPPCLIASPRDKAAVFRERYAILQQRTHRHDLFTPPVVGSVTEEGRNKFQLKTVEFLQGSTAQLGEVIVLGMLTQLKEGKYYLEDPTGTVQLDLKNAQFHSGLYTESCFVLAEGWYEDEVFHVNAVGFPPTEAAKISRTYFGDVNLFGGPSLTSVKASAVLANIEERNTDAMFVFVSDVWLDRTDVLDRLRLMFTGYSGAPPTCFIFCGNFSSAPYGRNHTSVLIDSLKCLADIICEFPSILESRFVFVPGPEDPGPGAILPRSPLANHITAEFRRRVPSAIFATNPCRLQYCTQEVVIFREDLVNKMCRNCVRFPNPGTDIPTHFVKTLVSQGHLSSLPLFVSPVFWGYDYTLSLYPLPDLLVCADKYDPFSITNTECMCINPGSFPRSEFSFKVYYPSSRTVEDSKLQDM
ncbi:DNA polymerase epsilon subunit 2 isoform X2 [Lethenteron reissneri]|uniref:DNA polymerase epsilon subunit 2 isoform X2 n=1 Tax=Lethenteron reissneri TaxID=7753 RepID=UPI002AB5EEB8|nr:DNA polymerase epsilon subunit 2 isoform X2 [Lethenteron reissneri]